MKEYWRCAEGERKLNTHNYKKFHDEYSKLGFSGSYFLAFRDIPKLLKGLKGKALDYGCGTGRSTQFIKSLGFETVGVDISQDMLNNAKELDRDGEYKLIESGRIPYPNNTFDLVFSSFVFLEVSSYIEIETICKEINRVLKPKGKFVFVTNSITEHNGEWLSFSYDFPENNRKIKSGDKLKLLIKNSNIILYDYYWSENDYRSAIKKSRLKLVQLHEPLGQVDDGVEWKDESRKKNFAIYVAEKGET